MRRVGASGRSGSEEAVQPPLTERLTDDAKDPECSPTSLAVTILVAQYNRETCLS